MLCPSCQKETDRPGKSYCRLCHNDYVRKWSKAHPLRGDARKRMIARSYANVNLRRGKIQRGPCIECGNPKAQMHHNDYSKPKEITWLCADCHHAHHRTDNTRTTIAHLKRAIIVATSQR